MRGWRLFASVVWWVLLGGQYALIAFALLEILIVGVLGGSPVIQLAPGWVFVYSAIALVVSIIFLIFRGNKVLLGRGRGLGGYLRDYLRHTPRWLSILHLVLIAGAIALIVNTYAIGAANVQFSIHDGHHLITASSGPSVVNAERYVVMLRAATVFAPVSSALVASVFGVTFLLGDRARQVDAGHDEQTTGSAID